MSRIFLVPALSLAAVLLAAPHARGQAHALGADESQRSLDTHRGFWLSGGLGGGWMEGDGGAAVYIRLGGTPSNRLLLGGEVLVWTPDPDAEDVGQANVTATALWYPIYQSTGSPGHDWFVKAGVGFATADNGFRKRDGFGVTLGSGYDFRLGNNLYLTPNLDVLIQFLEQDTDVGVLITLGLGFH